VVLPGKVPEGILAARDYALEDELSGGLYNWEAVHNGHLPWRKDEA
jgi:hypothetical protein